VLAPFLAALTLATCPHDASLGHLTYARGTTAHVLSFADCSDRVAGRPPTARSTVPTVVARRLERLVGRLPGAYGLRRFVVPVSLSPDRRYVVWRTGITSASLTADGLPLSVTALATGATHVLGVALAYDDYVTWCGSTLVYVAGHDRIATHDKRLLAAGAPGFRARPLWRAPGRAFGSVACAPDGRAVAVLSQRASTDARFFDTRWQLWHVGLDGARSELDAPPAGWADESPSWSPDGSALLFVRERNGYGRAMLLRQGTLFGPMTTLGYSLGFYGHHDWWEGATWAR
jgi:hypothetical protein